MTASRTRISRIHGQRDVDDVAAGTGEAVAVEPSVAEAGTLVGLVGLGVVAWVEVSVGSLVADAFAGALVGAMVGVGVLVGPMVGVLVLAGMLAVRETTGVREGSAGRLTERVGLGRFEPPSHADRNATAITRSPIERKRRRSLINSPFHSSRAIQAEAPASSGLGELN